MLNSEKVVENLNRVDVNLNESAIATISDSIFLKKLHVYPHIFMPYVLGHIIA